MIISLNEKFAELKCIPKREILNTNQNLRYHKEAAYVHESVKGDHQGNHIVKREN